MADLEFYQASGAGCVLLDAVIHRLHSGVQQRGGLLQVRAGPLEASEGVRAQPGSEAADRLAAWLLLINICYNFPSNPTPSRCSAAPRNPALLSPFSSGAIAP